MRWVLHNDPLDPKTASLQDVAAAKRMHDLGVRAGAIVGMLAALAVYLLWSGFGYEHKWVEYTMLPAILIVGALMYRLTHAIVVRFRP